MTRRVIIAVAVLVTGLVLAPGRAGAGHESLSALLPGDPLEGSRLFAGKGCVACHSVHGVGGTAGPDLGRGVLNRPLLQIAAIMWNHSPGMEHVFLERRVARPVFAPAEMASLIAFLYYLGSMDPPGDAERGRAVFTQKSCDSCHGVGERAGKMGPDLKPYGRYASPLFLTTGLWNRGSAMAEAMAARRIERPLFRGADIPDLLAYIRSAGGGLERVYASPGSPKRGEALFTEKHCAECHAIRGHGGKVGPDLALQLRGSLMQIAGSLWNHGPRMWSRMAERRLRVPSFTTEEMSDLVGYLYFLQFLDPPGDAQRGWTVYKEKRCGSCHGSTGPRSVAPAFARVVEKLQTPLAVITAMWNHAGRMTEAMEEQNVAWPVLKGGEMADLMAYLLASQRRPATVSRAGGSGAPGPAETSRSGK